MNRVAERPWFKIYSEAGISSNQQIPEITVYQLLEDACFRYTWQTAIIYEDEKITYQELKNKVDKLAASWRKLGVQKGERIGLMLPNHPDYVITYFAAQKLGSIVVQINPMYTARELSEIFIDADIRFLVLEPKHLNKIEEISKGCRLDKLFVSSLPSQGKIDGEVYSIQSLIESAVSIEEPTPISVRDDIAVIQYTGGTTGEIKGAMLTHYNLVANVIQSRLLYGKDVKEGREITLTAAPLYHVYAMTAAMNLSFYIGATMILVRRFKVEKVLNLVKKYRPTFFPGVPSMYNAFINHPDVKKYRLNCLRFCSCGSAPLPLEVIKRFRQLTGSEIAEGYGMSETSPTTHRNPMDGIKKVGSIGIPVPETDCKIVDNEGDELSPGNVGELVVKGPQVMKGYLNREKETNQALSDGWLYTGDLAKMDRDGYFYIVGRKKEMIITSGFNVYPQEIENILYDHPAVKETAVVGLPDKRKGEITKAFVVLKDGEQADVEELKNYCYRNLTRYKVPKLFEIRDRLPRNSVGKLLKRILIEEEKEKHSNGRGN